MLRLIILCILPFVPVCLMSECLFERYYGNVVPQSDLAIIQFKVARSVSECEKFCLDHAPDCEGASLVPIRAGLYSCELTGTSPDVDSLQANDKGVVIRKIDICAEVPACQHGGTCVPLSLYPLYHCNCVVWCYGLGCERCYDIPGLYATNSTLTLPDGATVPAVVADDWIFLLRRWDGSVEFTSKVWEEYKYGFGDFNGEFWFGNEWVSQLTASATYLVRFDLVTFDGIWGYAEYTNFSLAPESDNYRIHVDQFSGNATDGLTQPLTDQHENGMQFSTTDRDNDLVPDKACCCGGWWKNKCGHAGLTGTYGLDRESWNYVIWYPFSRRLAYADMKMKRV